MANQLLRHHKDATTAKLQLALFTKTLEDEKDLGARVAHLERELAGVALSAGRDAEALHALVAAASAYKALGSLAPARSCLERARLLKAGDEELQELLGQALAAVLEELDAAKPKPAPVPAPPAKQTLKTEPKPAPAPAAPAVDEAPLQQEEKPTKKKKTKKKAPKSGDLP